MSAIHDLIDISFLIHAAMFTLYHTSDSIVITGIQKVLDDNAQASHKIHIRCTIAFIVSRVCL